VREHRRHLAQARQPALALACAVLGLPAQLPANDRDRNAEQRDRGEHADQDRAIRSGAQLVGLRRLDLDREPHPARIAPPAAAKSVRRLDAQPAVDMHDLAGRSHAEVELAPRRAGLGDDLTVVVDERDVADALVAMLRDDRHEIRGGRRSLEVGEVGAHGLILRDRLAVADRRERIGDRVARREHGRDERRRHQRECDGERRQAAKRHGASG